MEKSTQPEAVSSVLKVFNILESLGEQKEIGVSDLSQRLMMSKATTYRFLQTMKMLGYVSQQGEADRYSLTLKMFELGSKSLEWVDMITIAEKEMRVISEETNETIHLGALDHGSIIYIHKIDSSFALRMHSRVGRRNPLHTTAIGKVLLAERDEEFVRTQLADAEFVKSTKNTLENVDQLVDELKAVKLQHFGEDNEEQEPGLRCIAAPVYDRFGTVIAGVSISFPTIRFDEEKKAHYVELLHNAGRNISKQLGFNDYPIK
ncbi:DNA-binding transcriptional regulator KdgR [Vibrio cyclitrophicus]|jgi:IclR family KDG regulon transcriptional repressor|uniref:DNA-binding transcriptional regulator KdgR n=2 Tax=Vibrio cyclitrophicus TaxID=47951 RepID=A0A7Z1RYT2_9VIBR|nr:MULTISPECIES: DNA-binding transcriptional regulator KdgR [Vibrio]ERM58148.1 Transcriptional regulator KdgR, KDG operon repressor [Vibrio cyclitrophicus FF75]KAA8602563.1 Transcriptional regulator KdgR KDG operon repressor [Vibrio cyclitrophicus]MBE8558089.1 DNA-binding transcriptional regulator KdgR [Vibrio sp. OPT24]MBE8604346.1 DNA-binding transcriptional regulator KdgR [Vibrio sp. OPT10]MCC4772299.1 DNA-binding transcriptional regulator KdgR [Vibrio cyclitrophicus]|tara:strand:+ start:454 stop:1239 length:786 start_codon:yes stop_codon:yes gene_type:complete